MIRILLLSVTLIASTSAYSQYLSNRVQVYIGGPNFLKWGVNLAANFEENLSYKGTPVFGGSYDRRILSWLSVGGEFNFKQSELTYTFQDSALVQQFESELGFELPADINPYGDYQLNLPRYRVLVNANFHVLPEESNADLYFGLAMGYNKTNASLKKDNRDIIFTNKLNRLTGRLAYRTNMGFAYHFASHIGLFGELGIGGPLLTVGISGRF